MLINEPAVLDLAAVEEFEHRWERAWNDHDAEGVAALCAEDLVYDEPALGGTVYGRDHLRSFVTAMNASFPDHVFHFQGLYADVTRRAVLLAWRFTGTHAETGKKVEFHGDDRLEFGEDGLVSAYRCIYDNHLVLRQIGKKPR
ncbi:MULTISPECIES: nuclear transport factor 2 family protein [Mycobacterium]|uniref:SnoaL-like domain-containing protein n=1 Tax=Mycobacterium colombiense TaxID=339268 RepID=A0A329M8P5_9MYCO|nr:MULTISPECIES: nuclear transport factor 2 family protein [Mycobacterium]MDM4139317.1 nuclear transport factor 2 family protein [Mycobacterium sp. FLAC0960]RAV16539.1 hypothetical protein DQP57_02485 [Mycobacterium colombiense]